MIFIALILIFSNSTVKSKIQNLINREEKSLDLLKEIEIDLSENYEVNNLDNQLILYDGKEIAFYDLEGTKKSVKELSGSELITKISDKEIFIADKKDTKLTAITMEGSILWQNELDKEIDEMFLRGQHLIVFTHNLQDSNYIYIFDLKGNQLVEKEVIDGQAITTNVFKNKQGYVIGKFNLQDKELVSNLAKYSINGSLLWSQNFQNEIIQDVKITNDNTMIITTDKKIYHMTSQKELLWSRGINGQIWDIGLDNEGNRLVLLMGETKENLEIIGVNGRTINKMKVENIYNKIKLYNKTIILFSDEGLLGLRENKKNFKYNSQGEIKDILLSNESIFVIMNDNIKIMKVDLSS